MTRATSEPKTLARTIARTFAPLIAFLVVLAALAAGGLLHLYQDYQRTIKVHQPTMIANQQVLSSMINLETAIRGYENTGDPVFLEPWNIGTAAYPGAISELRRLAREDARMAAEVEQQDTAALRWLDEYARPIVEQRSQRPSALEGKQRFDLFRVENAEVAAEIERVQRNGEQEASAFFWTVMIVLPTLAFGGVFAALLVMRRVTQQVADPLRSVSAALDELREGDASVRVKASGPAEVQRVSEAVNELARTTEELNEARIDRAKRDALLRYVTDQVRESLEPDVVLQRTVDEIADVLNCDWVRVSLFASDTAARDAERRTYAQWTKAGLEPLGDYPLSEHLQTVVDEMLVHQRVLVINDSQDDVRINEAGAVEQAALGIHASLGAPIVIHGKTRGFLVAYANTARQWSPFHQTVIAVIARELSVVLKNAQLLEDERNLVSRLKELDRTRSDFVSSISHELRTPLTSIMGYTELLTDGLAGPLTAKQISMVEVVERNTERLLTLIEDLLLLSRIEDGKFELALRPNSFADMADSVVAALAPSAQKAGVAFDVEVPAREVMVLADGQQIERVLMNLLSNAVKFSDPDSVVHLRATVQGRTLHVAVSDHGMGISPEDQRHLFKRFFRSAAAGERAVPGTGLGLTIVKNIVEAHGGEVVLESALGEGTRVSFRLPVSLSASVGLVPAADGATS